MIRVRKAKSGPTIPKPFFLLHACDSTSTGDSAIVSPHLL